MAKNRLRVIPLGGAGEVGRNCWALEYDDDILVLDMGVMFPESEMLGVDLILPDVTYLQERKAKIQGVFITHGHEDHIGAIPYLLPMIGFPPLYATALTLGLVQPKLKEHKLLDKVQRNQIEAGGKYTVGVLGRYDLDQAQFFDFEFALAVRLRCIEPRLSYRRLGERINVAIVLPGLTL